MNTKENIEILAKIERYILGELSQEEIDDLWVEFLKNPEYYKWFETELHLRGLARKGINPFEEKQPETVDETESEISKINSIKTWVLAAAATVLLVVGLQFFSVSEEESTNRWAIASIEHTEMVGADVLRSDEEEVSDFEVSINEALSAAYEEEFDEAIEKFEWLYEQAPNNLQRAKIGMNLGILHYNLSEYEPAKTYFQSVLETEEIERFVEEKAWWFLGNAHLNLRELEEAREAVFNAYSLDGRFQNPALSLLKKLDVRLGYVPSAELD